jgi:NADP-dependent alcohol dehydrogenase
MLSLRRDSKREKLLQYADRVWNIREGSEEQRIDAAISKTRDFFENMQVKTRLSAYQITKEHIPALLAQLEKHGMVKLGEHGDVTIDISRTILEISI